MIYADPVPAEMASGRYYEQAGDDYYLSPAKLESDYAESRFARELAFFRQHCTGGAVLDVGCSSGAFLFHLERRFPGGYARLGTDVSGPPLDYAESRGVPVWRGDFLRSDWRDRFAAVTFWAVLEHLADPAAFLARAREALQPGGLCFVLVPNMDSLAVRLLGARYRYVYPQHLNYFTRATLARLAGKDFAVIGVRSTHFNPVVIWQDWRGRGGDVSNAERAALLRKTTGWKENRRLGLLRALYRLTERGLGAMRLADNLAMVLRRR